MKSYFCQDGCLTDEAFQDLINGKADELARLEIAEHLSFCDKCVERYVNLLCEEPLLDPVVPAVPKVQSEIRRKMRTVFFNRYMRVGVAACLTLILWLGGVFSTNKDITQQEAILPKPTKDKISHSWTEKTADFSQQISGGIGQFFDQFTWKGVFQNDEEKK